MSTSTRFSIHDHDQVNVHVSRRLLLQQVPGTDSYIVFNPLNGLVDVASSSDIAVIGNLQRTGTAGSQPERALADYLLERGLAFRSADAEEAALEEAVASARRNFAARVPSVYTVCPTLACNLSCAYCFEGDSLRVKPQGVMSEQTTQRLFAAIDSLESERAERQGQCASKSCISLFGGEPFLPSTRACVAQVMGYAQASGMTLAATTNGVNVARFEDLLTRHADLFDSVQITLDGPKAMHDSRRHRLGGQGTFEEIVRGIDLLVEIGIDVNLRVNLDLQNLPTLPELCEFVRDRGWSVRRGVQMIVAPVTVHAPQSGDHSDNDNDNDNVAAGCAAGSYSKAMDELAMHRALVALAAEHAVVSEVCSFAHLRHLDHLTHVIDERAEHRSLGSIAALQRRTKADPGPRYWYCEQGTGQQWVFTPDGHVYTCTEAVGKVRHAIGRFDPELTVWKRQSGEWLGRTILSHPKCRACSISTLCGGGCHFAARERESSTQPAGSARAGDLLQIQVGRANRSVSFSDSGYSQETKSADPYCAGAEQIVREYLSCAGKALLSTG